MLSPSSSFALQVVCAVMEGSLGASVKAPMHPCVVLKGGSLQVLNGATALEFGMVHGVSGCSPWRNLCVENNIYLPKTSRNPSQTAG